MTRAVEPDFKKSNKKPDAKVGYRRLYPISTRGATETPSRCESKPLAPLKS